MHFYISVTTTALPLHESQITALNVMMYEAQSPISRNQQSRACCSKLAATQRETWCKGLWVSTDLSLQSHIGPRRVLIPTEGKQWEGGRALLIRDRMWNGAGSSKVMLRTMSQERDSPVLCSPPGPAGAQLPVDSGLPYSKTSRCPARVSPGLSCSAFSPVFIHSFTQRSSIIR